jgi:hypothetical protein
VKPKIKRLSFPKRGKFQVDLQDGRSVVMPVSAFPSLKKVPVKERDNWYLMGGGVTWDSCPEVIHIEQILTFEPKIVEIFNIDKSIRTDNHTPDVKPNTNRSPWVKIIVVKRFDVDCRVNAFRKRLDNALDMGACSIL